MKHFTCSQCPKSFLYGYNLRRHERKEHAVLQSVPNKPQEEFSTNTALKEESRPSESKMENSRAEKKVQDSAKPNLQPKQKPVAAAAKELSTLQTVVNHVYPVRNSYAQLTIYLNVPH